MEQRQRKVVRKILSHRGSSSLVLCQVESRNEVVSVAGMAGPVGECF